MDVCAFVLQKNLYFKVEKTSQKKVSYKNFQFLVEINFLKVFKKNRQ